MTAVPAGTTWHKFNEIREIPTSSGGKFYMFRHLPDLLTCRMDERFAHLIQPEIEALKEGWEVELACIPDPTKTDLDKNKRISLKYYEARFTEGPQPEDARLEQIRPEPTAESLSKSVTFDLSIEEHAFITALHKKMRQSDVSLARFKDFNAYLFSTQIRLLRLQHPDLWSLPADMPF